MFNKTLNDIISYIKYDDNVLEIGCGTGRYLNGIKRLLKDEPHGIDISFNTIEKYTKSHKGIIPIYGDFLTHPFEIKYDFIYAITVLEYITVFRIKKFFSKLFSILKLNGQTLITFPHSEGSKLWYIQDLNYTKYPIEYIIEICRLTGFEILDSGKMEYKDTEYEFEGGAFIIIKKVSIS